MDLDQLYFSDPELLIATGALDIVGADDDEEILAAMMGADTDALFSSGAEQLLFGADEQLLFGADDITDPDIAALSSVVSGSSLLNPIDLSGLDIIGASNLSNRQKMLAAMKRKQQLQALAMAKKKKAAMNRVRGLIGAGIQPTLTVDRGYTKARVFPFGFQADADTPPGAPGSVTRRPQTPLKVRRLVVPSIIAPSFLITDIKVGKDSQFVGSDPIPAETFAPNAVAVELTGDTASVGHDVTIAFTNISGAAQRFRAVLIGPAVE